MVIKSTRDSVGTTKKPTSTNKKEMMLKVRRTSISKREETGREIKRATPEEVLDGTRKADPEERTSRQTQSKMTKTGTREEPLNKERTSRSDADLDRVAPKGITTTHIPTKGMTSVEDRDKEACHQWNEGSSLIEITCHLTASGATMISMLDLARAREREASKNRHTMTTELVTGHTFSCMDPVLVTIHSDPTDLTLTSMEEDPATAGRVHGDPIDQMIEKAWAATLIREDRITTRTTTQEEESREVTQATSKPTGL